MQESSKYFNEELFQTLPSPDLTIFNYPTEVEDIVGFLKLNGLKPNVDYEIIFRGLLLQGLISIPSNNVNSYRSFPNNFSQSSSSTSMYSTVFCSKFQTNLLLTPSLSMVSYL